MVGISNALAMVKVVVSETPVCELLEYISITASPPRLCPGE